MPEGKEAVAQAFYLAQLQACKGKCQCNVCKLLRSATDQMTAEMIQGKGDNTPTAEGILASMKEAGISLEELTSVEVP